MTVPSPVDGRPVLALPLREDLVGRVPYGAPQLDVPVRLNTNENPYPPPTALADQIGAAVAAAAVGLNRYPDREAYALRSELGAYVSRREAVAVGPDQVWAANGSNEIMLQLFQAFGGPGRTALGCSPTYAMYPDYARDTFTRWVTVPRDDDFQVDVDATRAAIRDQRPALVVLASPNNPTGGALPMDTLVAVCDVAPGLVVVDEAYAEFRRPETPSALELTAAYPQLVVTRTLSKAFALAGARIGYLVARAEVVDAVRLVRLPYHLSSVSQAVASTALEHADALQAALPDLRRERDDLVGWLRSQGYAAADSDANFVLFGRFGDRHAVWSGLLAHGVLVREVGPDGWLRVSIGTPSEMAAFKTALAAVAPGRVDNALVTTDGSHG